MSISSTNLIFYYPLDSDFKNYTATTSVIDATNDANASIVSRSMYVNSSNTNGLQTQNINMKNTDLTIAFWFKLGTYPNTVVNRIMTYTDGGTYFGLYLAFDNALHITRDGGGGNTSYTIPDSNFLTLLIPGP